MKYLSTRNNNLNKSFNEILFEGLSEDGGLFMPHTWPHLDINNVKSLTYIELAHKVISPFVHETISNEDLLKIIKKTYDNNFDHKDIAPLVKIDKNKYILELFYGPTLAFKDYALQFLANLFSYNIDLSKKKLTILGATSGDTGSAAIEAFKDKSDIDVFILHPKNMVSDVQRLQMTTVTNKNINNIGIEGTFDDCQKIVKQMFLDKEIQSKTRLIAINSINFIRLLAQTVYFFWAFLKTESSKINFIVPTGNFGNVFSARIAKYMGLPIEKLFVATNENDILFKSIMYGKMKINAVKKTYSPSMDIQISSNFERQLFESVNRDTHKLNEIMKSFSNNGKYILNKEIIDDLLLVYSSSSVSNDDTLETINYFKSKYNYLSDPHTATGLNIMNKFENLNFPHVSLACAHPSKFDKAIKIATKIDLEYPEKIKEIFNKKEKISFLPNNYNLIKSFILDKIL